MFFTNQFLQMYTSMNNIQKDNDLEPNKHQKIAQEALSELMNTQQELKSDLKGLYIKSANQIDVPGNQKAVVIRVPYRFRKPFRKIHAKLIRKLEQKYGMDVVFIATRKIVRPPKKGYPRSRTLKAMLEDVVHPAKIVARGAEYRPDGSEIYKIFLDPKARIDTKHKLDTFRHVYEKLSGKNVSFFYYTEA